MRSRAYISWSLRFGCVCGGRGPGFDCRVICSSLNRLLPEQEARQPDDVFWRELSQARRKVVHTPNHGWSRVLPTKVTGHWKSKITLYVLIASLMPRVEVFPLNDVAASHVLASK